MRTMETSNVRRAEFALSEQTPLRATVNEEPRAPALLYDMHYELELGIVLSGRMTRRFERFQYDARPGQVWLCGIWEPHGYRVASPRSRALVIVIRPELLVQMRFAEAPQRNWLLPFTVAASRRPSVAPVARAQMLELAERFMATFADSAEMRPLRQHLLLVEILLTLTRGWQGPKTEESPANSYARIRSAVELVFKERGMISAVAAARLCGLSRNHFDRLFQGVMHLSFARFALRYRLGSAAGQLMRTDDALKKIADDWGFTDASHLVHSFRQHYGCTPLMYRERKQAEQAAAAAPSSAPSSAQSAGDSATGTEPASRPIAWNARIQRVPKR